jgi:hypothetical protein
MNMEVVSTNRVFKSRHDSQVASYSICSQQGKFLIFVNINMTRRVQFQAKNIFH